MMIPHISNAFLITIRGIGISSLVFPLSLNPNPYNMPLPLGKSVDISVIVNADHAGKKVTRRSYTGIIVYCNLSPISWYSKRQNIVETSTFGSEFVALRIATEMIEGLL